MRLYNHALERFTNSVFLFSSVLISIIVPTHQVCYDTGNFTANSNYDKNRNLIFSSLASDTSQHGGFYTTTVGQEPDQVYALALCRGDSTSEICASCVNATIRGIINECPNQKEAFSWGSQNPLCLVHYANRSFFQKPEIDPHFALYNPINVTDFANLSHFDDIWQNLIHSIRKEASHSSCRLKFASGEADLTYSKTIYALMQCTSDLNQSDCEYCLGEYASFFHERLHTSVGGEVKGPTCMFQWGFQPFYNDTQLCPPVLTAHDSITFGTIEKIVIPITVIMAIAIAITCFILRRRKSKKVRSTEEARDVENEFKHAESLQFDADKNEIKVAESLQFDFNTIRVATNNFSIDCKLGQGGFGAVYKGRLPHGQDIAVKRLSKNSRQGDLEFKNEVFIVARLQHKNLVRLLGFCLEGKERLLVYEFLPNSSLDKFLFDLIKCLLLDWEKRCKIIEGVARGVHYLHEDSVLRIIHRDLKVSNILLDENMVSKISDFGMARLFELDQSQDDTSRIVGTLGYMAPEYARRGHFSVKSDVFSFGVLVLEIISGQKHSCFHNEEEAEGLLSYAWRNWKDGTALNIIDPKILGSSDEMVRAIHIGLLCVQENEASRPTMGSIISMLTRSSFSLEEPSEPAFFMHTTMAKNNLEVNLSNLSKNNSVRSTVNEASIT